MTSALHGPLRAGFTQASHAGWWIVAGCGTAVLLIGLLTSGRWARATAARTAERLMSDEAEDPGHRALTASSAGPSGPGSAGGGRRVPISEKTAPWSSLTMAIRP